MWIIGWLKSQFSISAISSFWFWHVAPTIRSYIITPTLCAGFPRLYSHQDRQTSWAPPLQQHTHTHRNTLAKRHCQGLKMAHTFWKSKNKWQLMKGHCREAVERQLTKKRPGTRFLSKAQFQWTDYSENFSIQLMCFLYTETLFSNKGLRKHLCWSHIVNATSQVKPNQWYTNDKQPNKNIP